MTANLSAAVPDLAAVAVRSIHAMADGDRAAFEPLYHPQAVDRESRIQPPSSRVPGAGCFYSTALWLRAAFAGLRYDIHHAISDGNLVAVNSTMHGRHTAPWVLYDEDGAVGPVFPATGKPFAMTQSHWFRMEDGRIIEHWANRDDLGMARQLGWAPPTPAYLARMSMAKRRAKRSLSPEPPHNRDMTRERRQATTHGLAAALDWIRAHLPRWRKRPPTVGVREPRRPRPTLPAAALALKEPQVGLLHRIRLHSRRTDDDF